MALTKAKIREILTDVGVDSDRITEAANRIYDGYSAAIDVEREENAKLKERIKDADRLQKELDDLNASLKDKDYDKLQKEFEDYKTKVKTKETQAAKEKAYRAALKDANLTEKGIEKALKYADWNSVELEDDGSLKDAKSHIKSVREEWAEYITKAQQQGAQTATPPQGQGDNHTPSRAAMVAKKHYEAIYGTKGDQA